MIHPRIKLFFILITIPFLGLAQGSYNNPLSYYGYGLYAPNYLTADIGMGGANSGLSQNNLINIGNPASYHFLYTQQVDVGFASASSNFNINGNTFSTSGGGIRSFAYGFPFGKRFGVGLALKPFSSNNYELAQTSTPTPSSFVTNVLLGDGGFNNFSAGLGVKLFQDSLNIISLGANVNYLFGFATDNAYTLISDASSSNFNTHVYNRTGFNGVYGDVGILYNRRVSKKISLGLGLTYTPPQKARAFQTVFSGSFSGQPGFELTKDTILFSRDTAKMDLPSSIGLGLSLEIGKGLVLNGSYKTTQFSGGKIFQNNLNISDRSEFSVGVQYIPNVEEYTKLLKVARYRVGGRFVNTGLSYAGRGISEFGITFGLGLPLLKSQSLTSFNISAEVGNRSNGAGYSEQFNNIYVGVSIAPHKFDRWFIRRKID